MTTSTRQNVIILNATSFRQLDFAVDVIVERLKFIDDDYANEEEELDGRKEDDEERTALRSLLRDMKVEGY